jgi:hypothetical protein
LLSIDAERSDFVDEVYVTDEHTPAAVSLKSEIMECLACVLAFFDCVQEFLILMSNHLSTTPTSYWD